MSHFHSLFSQKRNKLRLSVITASVVLFSCSIGTIATYGSEVLNPQETQGRSNHLFHYSSDLYNTLPSVEDAYQKLTSREDFEAFLSVAQQIALKHMVEEHINLRLIHRHDKVGSHEAMVENPEQYDKEPALVTAPIDQEKLNNATPASWLVKGGSYYVFEYSTDKEASKAYELLESKSEFFSEFAELLIKHNFQNLLAPAILDREIYKSYTGKTLFLERSVSRGEGFVSLIKAENAEDAIFSTSIRTSWLLTDKPIMHGCSPWQMCMSTQAGGHVYMAGHRQS